MLAGCDTKHYKYLYCCASHHHTITPRDSGHVKMASVSSVRGHRPHDGWQHITPCLSCFSFISKRERERERDGVILLWVTGWWVVYSAEESKHSGEVRDNNSQSSVSPSHPSRPLTWLLASLTTSPQLTYQCLPVFP